MVSVMLLTAAVALGQDAAASDAPASPPAPDRYFLMTCLQGTPLGACLDAQRFQVTGWVDASFTASSVAHNQLPFGFNYLANQGLLQQNWLRLDRSVVTDGTNEATFGFRSDTILPGSDYRFTAARGMFSGQLTANDGRPNTYGIDPIQLYGEAYFPTIGKGLDVKLGRVFCQYGVETNDAPSNALLSHAYTFIYDPFTYTGVVSTLSLSDTWSVQFGVVLGSDVFIDPAASPTGMGSVKWAPPDGKDSVQFSFIAGSGTFNQARDFNNPEVLDFVYTHKFNDRWNYSYETLLGYQTHVPDIGTAYWFGVLNYLTYTFTPKLSATTRIEFFDDAQGQRTQFKGLYNAFTAGVSYKPHKAITLRPEVRFDYNGESRPFENNHGLFTASTDVILRW
jgi:hypothetical protein